MARGKLKQTDFTIINFSLVLPVEISILIRSISIICHEGQKYIFWYTMECLGLNIVHVKVVLGSGGVIPGLNRTQTFKIFLASVLVQPCQFIN